jgi:hypothetical protein
MSLFDEAVKEAAEIAFQSCDVVFTTVLSRAEKIYGRGLYIKLEHDRTMDYWTVSVEGTTRCNCLTYGRHAHFDKAIVMLLERLEEKGLANGE